MLGVLLGFVALSVLLFAPVLAHPRSSVPFGGNDPILFTWWLQWDSYALGHAHLPLRTVWMNYPTGVNSMWNTSVLLLGVLMSPVTAVAGPVLSYNALMVLGPALSGWVCCLAARRWITRRWPAVFAGATFGFSPYFVAQSSGHLQLTFAVFPPLLLLLSHELFVVRSWPWRGLAAALGVSIAAQFYLGEEVLASSAVVAGLSSALLLVALGRRAWPVLPYALKSLGGAAVLAAVLVAPGLYEQFLGLSVIHGSVQSVPLPASDLLAPVVPTTLQLIDPLPSLSVPVVGPNLVEQTGYLGLPLLATCLAAPLVLRGNRAVWLAVPILTAGVLSLGASLQVDGIDTGIPLPWGVLRALPILDSLIPVRLSLQTALCAVILAACVVDNLLTTRHQYAAFAAAGVVAVSLAPSGPIPAGTPPVPAFFTEARDLRTLPTGTVALVAPYPGPQTPMAMLWQADAGMRFKMPGGYFLGPDSRGNGAFGQAAGPLGADLTAIENGQAGPDVTPGQRCAVFNDIGVEGIDEVLIGPMPHQDAAAQWVAQLTGQTMTFRDGVWVLRVDRHHHAPCW